MKQRLTNFKKSQLRTPYLVLSTEYLIASLLASVLFLCFANSVPAQELTDDQAIDAAKDALSSGSRYPWYDRSQDDVRRLRMVPRESEAERDEKWEDTSTPKARQPFRWPRLGLFGGVLQWLGLTALVLLLGLMAYLIATAFLKDEASESTTIRKVVESRRDADRVEALPFRVRAASGDFLSEARRLYEAGQYSQAIIYLFSHELVQLDKHHVIHLARGKTNRQYVRETRRRPALAAILETCMVAFEDAFFGKKTLSREAFDRCWNQLDSFEAELNRLERAAA
jgi:hypothetical protein